MKTKHRRALTRHLPLMSLLCFLPSDVENLTWKGLQRKGEKALHLSFVQWLSCPPEGRNEKNNKKRKHIRPPLSQSPISLVIWVIWVLTSWFDCRHRPPPRRHQQTVALRRSCAGSTACPRQSSPCGFHKTFQSQTPTDLQTRGLKEPGL